VLTTIKEMLADARAKRYAVPAFDCVEDVMVRAILETAEAHRSPVILSCLEPDLRGNGWHYVAGLIRAVAGCHNVPVALHMDHAADLETIQKALDFGFTSVMIDGSALAFDENVRLTQAAVALARPRGVTVEAELGKVGGMDLDDVGTSENVLTEPQEVAAFCERTGVDALAVSIGTSHGVYRSLPTLNIERLKQLHASSPVPLVLHGGSGTPDDQIRQSVQNGVCKLNIYADCRIAMARGLQQSAHSQRRKDPLPQELFGPIAEELAKVVGEKIELLSAGNRA
jgi:fructose-bisphosphate aldolase class II